MDPSDTLSPSATSRGVSPVQQLYLAPLISQRGEEGFASWLTRPVAPCRRYDPAGRDGRSQRGTASAAFALRSRARLPRL